LTYIKRETPRQLNTDPRPLRKRASKRWTTGR
jgi:hypothetical protein